jgi:hypothetical protein
MDAEARQNGERAAPQSERDGPGERPPERLATLERLQEQEDQRRVSTALERLAPLTVYFGPREWAA